MGRFYQTAKPEFVDDFIYQPPWELMQQRLQKEQNDYDVSLGTTDLLGHPDINYIEDEVEKQKVKEIQDEYNNRSLELAQKMKQAGNDWRKYLPEMNKLKRDLESDYKTGRIHNIQTSAANYAEMEKHLSTIKDPVIKERARQSFIEKWRENPNRSLDNVFQSNEVFDKKDLTGEFLAEWSKNKEPNIISKAFAYADGKGYLHNGIEETKIREDAQKAYAEFVKAKGYEPYLQQQENFGFGKYFEDDKKTLIPFTDSRSTGFQEAAYAGLLGNYKQESKKKDISSDSTYMGKLQLAEQRAARQAEYNASVEDSDAAPSIISNKFLAVNTALQNELLNNIKNNLKGKYNVNINLSNLMSTIKRIKEDPKYLPKTRKIILDTYNQMNKNAYTTKEQFYSSIGDKTKADNYIKNVEQLWKNNHKFYIGFDGNNISGGESGSTSSKRFSLDDINNSINSNGYFKIGNKKIESIELSDEVHPTMIDLNNLNNNYYTKFATAMYKDSKGNEQIITFPVHVPINEYNKFN